MKGTVRNLEKEKENKGRWYKPGEEESDKGRVVKKRNKTIKVGDFILSWKRRMKK